MGKTDSVTDQGSDAYTAIAARGQILDSLVVKVDRATLDILSENLNELSTGSAPSGQHSVDVMGIQQLGCHLSIVALPS